MLADLSHFLVVRQRKFKILFHGHLAEFGSDQYGWPHIEEAFTYVRAYLICLLTYFLDFLMCSLSTVAFFRNMAGGWYNLCIPEI